MIQYEPTSHSFSQSGEVTLHNCLYYGFITFATLGYGDLLLLKPYAKSLSILIAVCGQLYVAIIIALLVGKSLVKQSRIDSASPLHTVRLHIRHRTHARKASS